MITVLNALNFVNSEEYGKFLERLKKETSINIDLKIYIRMLSKDLSEINKIDIGIMDFKDILSKEDFFRFCIGRIKINDINYEKYIKRELGKIVETDEYNHVLETLGKGYKKYFIFYWMIDYHFLSMGTDDFLESLEKRNIPFPEYYKTEIMELSERIFSRRNSFQEV